MNIKEIAKTSGVSVATVSRVLNHPETVAPKTREKVLAIINELGYKPNWFARGLNFNKTDTIGLLIPSIQNPAYMEVAEGVEYIANSKGYTTLLCITEEDVEKERRYIQTLIDRRIDGIILVSSLLEDSDIQEIKKQNTAVVVIGENKGNSKIPIVRIDCFGAAHKAVKHLLNCGHRKIAMVYGSTPIMENNLKIKGYKLALKEAGFPINEDYLVEDENTIEGGYIAARKLLGLGDDRPDAIFATSDLLAFGVMDAIRDSNLSIAEDVAVMGFDNIRVSNLMVPKLTTVDKPLYRMGISGARLLLDVIESEDGIAMSEIILQAKLKIRKSCGHKERIKEIF